MADAGAIAIGELQDHLVDAGEPGRLDDILVLRRGIEAGDIVADRPGQEFDRLRQISPTAREASPPASAVKTETAALFLEGAAALESGRGHILPIPRKESSWPAPTMMWSAG